MGQTCRENEEEKRSKETMALEVRRQKISRKTEEKMEEWRGRNHGSERTGNTG